MNNLNKFQKIISNKNFNNMLIKLLGLITSSVIISSFFYLIHTISPVLGLINIIKPILGFTVVAGTYITTKDIYTIVKRIKEYDILDNKEEYNEIQKKELSDEKNTTINNQLEYQNNISIKHNKPKTKILRK